MTTERLIEMIRTETDKRVLQYAAKELDKRLDQLEGRAVARIKAVEKRQAEEPTLIIEVAA